MANDAQFSRRLSRPVASDSTRAADGKLKVFISYSRKDTDFVQELVAGLKFGGLEPFLDKHDIAAGEVWETRLRRLIESADTVVFVISPDSIRSKRCSAEVAYTEEMTKRLLPIVWRKVDEAEVPAPLKRLNYVYFDKPHSFAPALAELSVALRTNLAWVREHTRLLNKAQEWLSASKAENRLLIGKDIEDAKTWLAEAPSEGLRPTESHRDFINASDEAETVRLSKERRRAVALRRALYIASALAFVAIGAGVWAWLERGHAQTQARLAEQQEQVAARHAKRVDELLKLVLAKLKPAWPADDQDSPDYRNLADTTLGKSLKGTTFEVTPAAIELLISANSFNPVFLNGKLIVVMRGAVTHGTATPILNARKIVVKDLRPDHDSFRSLYFVYDRERSLLSAFSGSTVPNASAMRRGFERFHRDERPYSGNLQPTGSFAYVFGPHGSRQIPGCFLQGTSFDSRLKVAIRRTLNDLSYETDDFWHLAVPRNNLHPPFMSQGFSSAGSLTIKGGFANGQHIGEYAVFLVGLGLKYPQDHGRRIDMMLVTGLDMAIAAKLQAKGPTAGLAQHFTRLRHGSQGDLVRKLQGALGLQATGNFDADTTFALAQLQIKQLKRSDGIYSPEMDKLLGLNILGLQDIRPATMCPTGLIPDISNRADG